MAANLFDNLATGHMSLKDHYNLSNHDAVCYKAAHPQFSTDPSDVFVVDTGSTHHLCRTVDEYSLSSDGPRDKVAVFHYDQSRSTSSGRGTLTCG